MRTLCAVATGLATQIGALGPFALLSDGSAIPVFAFRLKETASYSVYDVSERLRVHGWQVPAYTMPKGAEAIAVLRIVVREGFSRDMADLLLADLRTVIAELQANPPARPEQAEGRFHHG